MKIAVTSTGTDLDVEVDPRFGRCRYLVIIDPETMQWEAVENLNAQATSGAGIATAQAVVDKGAEVLITGECGPKAQQALAAGGVQVVTGVRGTVREVVEAYRNGQLPTSSQASPGTSRGVKAGRGGGGGAVRGQGPRGWGSGGGWGQGRSQGRGGR